MKKDILVQWVMRFAPENPVFLPLEPITPKLSGPKFPIPGLWLPSPCAQGTTSLWYCNKTVTVNEAIKILGTTRNMVKRLMYSGDLRRVPHLDILGDEVWGVRLSLESVLTVLFHGAHNYYSRWGIVPQKINLQLDSVLDSAKETGK